MPAPASPIIALADVKLRLVSRAGPVDILRGVSLQVDNGQAVAIVGPSGSGKTSLLMIMAGLERATSGSVEVVGHDFTVLGEDALALVRGREIGIVFQSFHLVPTMTALENVALPLVYAGLDRRRQRERAQQLLALVDLYDRRLHRPCQLSGGQQQRVAIARAIVGDPSAILADEPTAALDSENGQAIMGVLAEIAKDQTRGVLVVTHDTRILPFANRVVRIEDGRIVGEQGIETTVKAARAREVSPS